MDASEPVLGEDDAPARERAAAALEGHADLDALERLRQILLGIERRRLELVEGRQEEARGELSAAQRELATAEARIAETRARIEEVQGRMDALHLGAEELADKLPEAVLLSSGRDRELATALEPPVEEAIRRSVNRNPRVLTDAIFPVMGPAIRKAIRTALAQLLESFNQALEHSLTLRGLSWRVEAWRTGRPFSEVVLLHSLEYRVEQVFLIHHETGLLLEHVALPDAPGQDADMVSGMLTAIQDFASDSFDPGGSSRELKVVQSGDLEILVEPAPKTLLAALVRGAVPEEFRARLREAGEGIALQLANELDDFDGDAAVFQLARPTLEELLEVRYIEGRERRRARPLALATLVVLALALAAPLVVWLVARRHEARRWNEIWDAVAAEPGIVVLEVEREGRRFEVSGLRDRDAREPAALLTELGADPERVDWRLESYLSLDSALLLRRATTRLAPPAGARLALEGPTLVATGRAEHAWIRAARGAASALEGIEALSTDGLVDVDLERLTDAAETLGERRLRFPFGSAVLDVEGAGADLIRDLRELARLAERAERLASVRLHGLRAVDEPDESLPSRRAAALLAFLSGELAEVSGLRLEAGPQGDDPELAPESAVRFTVAAEALAREPAETR